MTIIVCNAKTDASNVLGFQKLDIKIIVQILTIFLFNVSVVRSVVQLIGCENRR